MNKKVLKLNCDMNVIYQYLSHYHNYDGLICNVEPIELIDHYTDGNLEVINYLFKQKFGNWFPIMEINVLQKNDSINKVIKTESTDNYGYLKIIINYEIIKITNEVELIIVWQSKGIFHQISDHYIKKFIERINDRVKNLN